MKLLLLEDHPIFRFGVCQLILQRWPDADIVEAKDLGEGLEAVRNQAFQVAIIDLNLPDSDGLESVSKLRRAAPDLRILVLSLNSEAAYATKAFQMGIFGYLNKDRAAEELVSALDRILSGGRYVTSTLAERMADLIAQGDARPPHEKLSPQEYRVMLLMAEGRRLTDIGEVMHLSPKTISSYRTRILQKLGATSNVELVRYCISQGIIVKTV